MPKHRKFVALKLTALSAAVCLGLSGCLGSKALTGIDNEYPKEWESRVGIASSSLCADLAGNYQDQGEYSYLIEPESNNLSKRLTRIAWQAESVRLSLPDSDSILVEILEGKSVKHSETLRRSRGDFECESRGTKIDARSYSGGDFGGYSKSNVRLYLRTSVDGALIGEERNTGGGVLLWLVPLGGVQTIWFRWKKVE